MNRSYFGRLGPRIVLAAFAGAAACLLACPPAARACGGLFCSSPQTPVNQAAEQIIFSDNGDGTVTAVIQILYQGDAHEFAWVLPVAGKPDVGVSSDSAFAVLKQATNPVYNLSTVFDGCSSARGGSGGSAAPMQQPGSAMGAAGAGAASPVSIVSSGAIGPYEYVTIEVDESLRDRAQAAVTWLTDNGFDVGTLGPGVLRPYLDEGLNLLAFKLAKDSGTGSIRPILITYTSSKPAIPIRPTAVAANEDMGVMVFLLSDRRAIPANYKALELNEALINWFNASSNYNDVVSYAADEAAGQGFVTEFAGPHRGLGIVVFRPEQRDQWNDFKAASHPDPYLLVSEAYATWGALQGFDDALRRVLPPGADLERFKRCMYCSFDEPGFAFDANQFIEELERMVFKPLADTQALLDAHPYLTRLYTTMSAEEMTMDPVFAFNPDLAQVSNVHRATRRIHCDGSWSIDLAQGGTVVGSGSAWPIMTDAQPAALRIMEYGTSGAGQVVEDRSAELSKLNAPKPQAPTTSSAEPGPTAGTSGSAGSGSGAAGSDAGVKPDLGGAGGMGGRADDHHEGRGGHGCAVGAGQDSRDALSLLWLAALALLRRRRS